MKRTEYLEQLDKYLKRLPHEDYVEAMDYFTEYFDEAGPDLKMRCRLSKTLVLQKRLPTKSFIIF
ncbi:HAAS signaling domain-containing protein [Streptococcus sp. HF-1907]|uniref:HAAS signaling domain-containing protein n=1 Tax=Streptococcus sp. HF-1907 TaxID=2785793 RepID=UPI003B63744D